MNTSRKGSAAEVFVAKWLQDRGWLVASRRHIGGAGDLLAVFQGVSPIPGGLALTKPGTVWLIEVKARKRPYDGFRPEDRQAMRDTPLPPGGERWLVNKRGHELIWTHEKDWP